MYVNEVNGAGLFAEFKFSSAILIVRYETDRLSNCRFDCVLIFPRQARQQPKFSLQ
jgi:hypothetical protein